MNDDFNNSYSCFFGTGSGAQHGGYTKSFYNSWTTANAENWTIMAGVSSSLPAAIAVSRYGMLIQWRCSSISGVPTILEPAITIGDMTDSAPGQFWSYINYLGAVTVNSDEKLKHSIRPYNKWVLNKFKTLNIYTYAYKLLSTDINIKWRDDFNDHYRKAKRLNIGMMKTDIISKKQVADYIDDDDYINETFAAAPQEWKVEENEKIKNECETATGINYETLYKYSIIAIKELIIKVEALEEILKRNNIN